MEYRGCRRRGWKCKASRIGSSIACNAVLGYFIERSSIESMMQLDALLQPDSRNADEEIQKKLNLFVYNNLGKAVFHVHKKLEEFAAKEGITLKDLSTL